MKCFIHALQGRYVVEAKGRGSCLQFLMFIEGFTTYSQLARVGLTLIYIVHRPGFDFGCGKSRLFYSSHEGAFLFWKIRRSSFLLNCWARPRPPRRVTNQLDSGPTSEVDLPPVRGFPVLCRTVRKRLTKIDTRVLNSAGAYQQCELHIHTSHLEGHDLLVLLSSERSVVRCMHAIVSRLQAQHRASPS